MRLALPLAALRLATLPLAAVLLVTAPWSATAFERLEISPGDRLLVSITDVTTTHEYTLRMPRDASFRVKVKATKKSKLLPARGLVDEGYVVKALVPFGRSGGRTEPLPASGTYRLILQGANETFGDMQVDTALRPLKKARLKVREDDEEKPTELTFGALPGYEVSYTLKWKGDAPVRVAEIVGPGDTALTSTEPVKEKQHSAKGKGYATRNFGDHRVVLDVPEGTLRWDLAIKVKGRGTTGITRDLRVVGTPQPDALTLESYGVRVDNGGAVVVLPKIVIAGETGGPNGVIVGAAVQASGTGVPVTMAPAGCSATVPPGEPLPSEYALTCGETHSATIGSIVRDDDGALLAFVVSDIVTPEGTGRSVISGITYADSGAPIGWTEIRTFDGTGDVHRLVVRDVRQFPNSAYTFTVEHTTPDGLTKRYDYIPYR